ncbi:MAG: ABC transporter ATP-binding protein [Christensenellales bacterium]|jgi:NitT/TauT family transport system ATP-binding protein
MSSIQIEGLSVSYPSHSGPVLQELNLEIKSGEFVCIVGRSGCGKTTLLHTLAGLLQASHGRILIDGRPVEGPDTRRAVVFQNDSLFPWMTALQNVAFGIRQAKRGMGRKEARRQSLSLLERVGMADDTHKYPSQLSGGMQQRTALARALGMDAEVLLLDEAFGALDAGTRMELQQLLVGLWQGESRLQTVVFITHDVDEALLLADRVICMGMGGVREEVPVLLPRPRRIEALQCVESYQELRRTLLDWLDREQPASMPTRKGA